MNIQIRVASAQARQSLREIEMRVQAIEAAQRRANASAAGFGRAGILAMEKWGSKVQWAGRQLTYNFTMPIALAAGAATKFALDNEKAMTRLKKVYGDGVNGAAEYHKEIDALGRAFEALSNKYGVARADVINIAADWAAAGASGLALAKSTKLTIETMILGEMDAAQATKALISIQAQYGMAVDEQKANVMDLTKTIDILNMVENQTGASMSDLIEGFSRAAGVARSAGIDVRHLAAMMAALTPAAGSASQAGNAIKTMVSRLLSPTKEAAEVMDLMGINTKSMAWQSLNGTQRLQKMAESFSKVSTAQRAVVSSTIASRWQINKFDVLMRDMINVNGYYQKALNSTEDATANYKQRVKELNAVLDSSPQKFKQIMTVMQNVMADTIQPMLPTLVSIASAFANIFVEFQKLDPALQKLITIALLLTAAVGPILRYLGSLATLFGFVGGAALTATGWLTGFIGALFGIAAAPFTAVATGIGFIYTSIMGLPGALMKGMTAMAAMPGIIGSIATGMTVAGHLMIGFMKALPARMGAAVIAGIPGFLAMMNVALIPVANGIAAMFSTIFVGSFTQTMRHAWQIIGGRFSAFVAFGLKAPILSAYAWVGAQFTMMWTNIAAIFTAGSTGVMARFSAFMAVMAARLRAFPALFLATMRTLPMMMSVAWTGIGIAFSTGIKAVSLRFDMFLAGMYLRAVAWGSGISTFFATVYGRLGLLMASITTTMSAGMTAVMGLWPTITSWFYAAYSGLYAGLLKIQAAFAPASARLQSAWAAIHLAITRTWGTVITPLWTAIHAGLLAAQKFFFETSIRLWVIFQTGMTRLMTVIGTTMTTMWAATLAAMRGAWAATVLFLTSPVRLLAGMQVVMAGLAKVIMGIIPFLVKFGPMVLRALTGPWGLAITAVVALFFKFRDQLADIWSSITSGFGENLGEWTSIFMPVVEFFGKAVGWIEEQFWKLPKGVRDALMVVVRLVQSAADGIRQMFSNIFGAFTGGSAAQAAGQPPRRANGGIIEGPGTGRSDSILARVSNGEYIVNAQSTKKHRGALEAINADKYANGGEVGGKKGSTTGKTATVKPGGVGADLAAYQKIAAGLDGIEWNKEVANVAKGFASALPLMKRLLADWNSLNGQLDKAKAAVDAQQNVVNAWKGRLDAANASLDKQQAKLDGLQGKLDGLTAEYDKHKSAMDSYAQAPIAGMREMSDSIFENQMAQKKLQLQMLQWEKQHGSIDKIKNSMALLQGEIEKVQGNINDLRAGGAGSDITGPLEEQVKAMKDQYAAMGAQVQNSPVQQMQDQLDELARRGQELDLENSLKFDPLTRQVDQLVNGMKELPFDQIVGGITKEQAAMAALQPQIDAANAAVEKQKTVVDAATAARDKINATYDAEQAKLDKLKDTYSAIADQISAVEEAMRGLGQVGSDNIQKAKEAAEKALSPGAENFKAAAGANFAEVGGNAKIGREGGLADQSAEIDKWIKDNVQGINFDDIDMFKPIKDMWNSAWAWVEEHVGPVVTRVWNALTGSISSIFSGGGKNGVFNSIGEGFKNAWNTILGWWNGFVEVLKSLWALFGDDISGVWNSLVDGFKRLWNDIGPKVIDLFKNLGDLFVAIWPTIQALAGVLGGALLFAIKIVTSVLSNTLGPVINLIIDVLGGLIDVVKGVVEFFTGIFTLDMGRAMAGVKDVIAGTWDTIFGIFNGVGQTVLGVVKGLVQGVYDFFYWLWDVLVGHSIIPDLINAIVQWFSNAVTWVTDHVSALVTGVVDWFQKLPGRVWDVLVSLKDTLVTIVTNSFSAFWNTAKAAWTNIIDWFSKFGQTVWNNIIGIKDKMVNAISSSFTSFWNDAKASWANITGWFGKFGQNVWDKIISIKDKMVNVISTAFSSFWSDAKTSWSNITGWFAGFGQTVWDKVIGIKDKLIDVGGKAMTALFDKLKSFWDGKAGILQWFKDMPGKIGSALSGIGGTIGDAIRKGWNSAAGWINDHAINPINAVAGKFGLTLPGLPAFKDGGVIPGPRSAHDNMIVKVRSGEGVLIPEAVDRLGGKRGLEAFNKAAKNGTGNATDFGIGGSIIEDAINWAKQGVGYAIDRLTNGAAGLLEKFLPNPETLSKFASGSLRQIGAEARKWGHETDAAEAAKTGMTGLTPAQVAIINAAGTYWPVGNAPITAPYGYYPNSRKPHNGIDFGVPENTSVRAWRGGKVIKSGWDDTGYGNYIEILHANNTISRYGHNRFLLRKEGAIVQGNAVISKSGNTGNSTGPHLHFGIKKDGVATDPWPYLTGQKFDNGGWMMPGEGRHGNYTGKPEPVFTAEQWGVLSSLVATSSNMLKSVTGTGSGAVAGARGSAAVTMEARIRRLEGGPAVRSSEGGGRVVNINGDLVLPNIKSGEDADSFLKHLETLAG